MTAIDRLHAGHPRADLATYEGVEEVYAAILDLGRKVDAIALNAGRGIGGDFTHQIDLDDELNVIDVNFTSTRRPAVTGCPAVPCGRRSGRA